MLKSKLGQFVSLKKLVNNCSSNKNFEQIFSDYRIRLHPNFAFVLSTVRTVDTRGNSDTCIFLAQWKHATPVDIHSLLKG